MTKRIFKKEDISFFDSGLERESHKCYVFVEGVSLDDDKYIGSIFCYKEQGIYKFETTSVFDEVYDTTKVDRIRESDLDVLKLKVTVGLVEALNEG